MRTRFPLIVLLATGVLLAACHKQQEPTPENQVVEAPAPVAETPPPAPEPAPAPPPKVASTKPGAAPEPSADQQMIDDADATGMTSHTTHDADGSDAAGNSQQ